LLGLRFGTLLGFELGRCAGFLGFTRSALSFHLCSQRRSFAALDRGLVNSKIRSRAKAEDQDRGRRKQPRVNALALLRAYGRELSFVIEHARVRLRLLAGFLLQSDAKLGCFALALGPLFLFPRQSFFCSSCVLLRAQAGLLRFLPGARLGGDALALGGLALKSLFFFAPNTVLFDAHELAKVEENGRLFFLGHDDTYITLFRCIRTRSELPFSNMKTLATYPKGCQINGFLGFPAPLEPARKHSEIERM
jgi:hypothetical protein